MKNIFIPAVLKSKFDKNIISKASKKLPKNIAIAYSIQYKNIAYKLKEILSKEKKHKITAFIQVLGCSNPKFTKDTKAVLLISDGRFHAVSLALELNEKIPVYFFNGYSFKEITKKEISDLQKKKKLAYLKFLNAKKIGILVSLKPGQENLKRALKLKENLEKKDKDVYLFINNNININEFENFPEIQSWVNTACPRMDMDLGILNLSNLSNQY